MVIRAFCRRSGNQAGFYTKARFLITVLRDFPESAMVDVINCLQAQDRGGLRAMKRIGIILVSFLILIVLFHTVVYVVNNRIAKRLEQQLLNCPIPPNSEIIDSASVAGKLQGNGNGMEWFGIILIKSEMNEVELLQWYNSHVDIDKNDEIYVTRQKTSEIFDYSNLRFDHYSSEDCCYQIQIFRNIAIGTESSIWESLLNSDLRGH